MVVIDERLAEVAGVRLAQGAHGSWEEGACVMEAVSYVAGRPWSDHPVCVSPVVGAFLRRWNDDLDDEGRQGLKRLIPIVVGTATTRKDEATRAWMAVDWLVRVEAPAWLELAGTAEVAAALRALPELRDAKTTRKAQPTINEARKQGDAAWTAAWDPARDAAGAAVGAAARTAAGAAAWAAARDAAGDAAWAAAWAAARDAAGAAARDAAGAAAWTAAWAAARDALQPTAVGLKASALELVERMCAVGRVS